MKASAGCVCIVVMSARCITLSAGHGEWRGSPDKDSEYRFEADTGQPDRWDSAAQDSPQLSPGKASLAATKFVRTVPLRDDMKEWRVRSITLQQMSAAPEEWVYLVHFDAVPKADTWNGPVPSIDVPVRFDGTVPAPTITTAHQMRGAVRKSSLVQDAYQLDLGTSDSSEYVLVDKGVMFSVRGPIAVQAASPAERAMGDVYIGKTVRASGTISQDAHGRRFVHVTDAKQIGFP